MQQFYLYTIVVTGMDSLSLSLSLLVCDCGHFFLFSFTKAQRMIFWVRALFCNKLLAFQAWMFLLENPQPKWLHGLMPHASPPKLNCIHVFLFMAAPKTLSFIKKKKKGKINIYFNFSQCCPGTCYILRHPIASCPSFLFLFL